MNKTRKRSMLKRAVVCLIVAISMILSPFQRTVHAANVNKSEAANTVKNYILQNGTDSKAGKRIDKIIGGNRIDIIYEPDENVLSFGGVFPDAYDFVIYFDYDLATNAVKDNKCVMASLGSKVSPFFIDAKFTTDYYSYEDLPIVLNTSSYSDNDASKMISIMFDMGMDAWNEMIDQITGGKYNIGNLGFTKFRNPIGSDSGFTDVDSNAYYCSPVMWAVGKKITSGTSATTFGPGNPCTRGQIVTFLYHAYGNGEISSASRFSDVSPNAYYYQAVNWAVAKGITSGTGNGRFSPNAPCTRGQAMTFLYKAKQAPAVQAGAIHFTDVSPNQYFYDAVNWAVSNHITSGTSRTTFSPNDVCNRAQIVTFLYRAN